MLRAEYTAEEFKFSLSQMHPIKAPGPDGMCPMFFQSYWHIVGQYVTQSVLSILRGEQMSDQLNHTFITLIPKKSNATAMPDFRPISLCNVIYKLVSKVLANRLKTFLDKIIFVNQSVDTWWRDKVMTCVRSVTFYVLINRKPSNLFIPKRGLRQGDPLSPYLFILCAEVFSYLLRRAEEVGSLRGVKLAPLPRLSITCCLLTIVLYLLKLLCKTRKLYSKP